MRDEPSEWSIITPREFALERRVGELERELHVYRRFGHDGDALRYSTIREPETLTTHKELPEVRLRLAASVTATEEVERCAWHIICRTRTGPKSIGHQYYISNPALMQAPTYILKELHLKTMRELAQLV